jgi:quercetin dioxygenase-like cupin family protein
MTFIALARRTGPTLDLGEDTFPGAVSSVAGGALVLDEGATHHGFVDDGAATLTCSAGRFVLQPGMYFSVLAPATLEASGRAIVFSRRGVRGLFMIGGPVEAEGRLRYIDGCTDTLLVPPVVRGDPCLNLLHIPPWTRQSAHTHPSYRVGVIASGRGRCVTPTSTTPLLPGMAFHIPASAEHAFFTDDEALRVIAWHPDSDTGPVDDDHPMINRTIPVRR